MLPAIKRSRTVRCEECGLRGATLGCQVERCPCSFHLQCATKAKCTFYADAYLIACPSHAPLFKHLLRKHDRCMIHLLSESYRTEIF